MSMSSQSSSTLSFLSPRKSTQERLREIRNWGTSSWEIWPMFWQFQLCLFFWFIWQSHWSIITCNRERKNYALMNAPASKLFVNMFWFSRIIEANTDGSSNVRSNAIRGLLHQTSAETVFQLYIFVRNPALRKFCLKKISNIKESMIHNFLSTKKSMRLKSLLPEHVQDIGEIKKNRKSRRNTVHPDTK